MNKLIINRLLLFYNNKQTFTEYMKYLYFNTKIGRQ